MTKPNFIIVGAMKSATSTLHEQLALQPGIFMSTPKEPNFFSDDDVYQLGLGWYEHLFENATPNDICGESSTHYTKLPDYPHTINRMSAFLPELKLIYVIRHPVERLVSHYIHQWSQNVIRADINIAIDTFPELINYSLYSMQITPYIEQYGSENILLVFSEAFRKEPELELERVARFIGYDEPVVWHETLPEQNVSNQRVRRFKGYNFLVNNPILATVRRSLIPKGLRDFVKQQLVMKKRPELTVESQMKLEKIFNDDLNTLSQLTGTEINLANYKELAKNKHISLI
ncbi:sulfotransferase family protein [Methylophaga thalassica]|uniref:sulfotransferase family protein n=1 Tax=Methylophaga thalassica TaxID=40223 RepID=UPI002E7BBD11|nr:sulfotransferase domain-containing protein [Methylophaga thalassica]WVI84738.1 sulfotransferase domain-containing protein [Methylophaga thalassica]